MTIKVKKNSKIHAFNWASIRERMVANANNLSQEAQVTPEVLERIWAKRAAQLAKVPIQEAEGTRREIALIRLGRELFGVSVEYVLDIRPARQITHVPRVPKWVTGVTNLRGRLLSVIDLTRFFELPEGGENAKEEAYLVVVSASGVEVALWVSEVLGVEAIRTDAMGEATIAVASLPPEYVQGVVKCERLSANGTPALCVVLDLAALLADERLIIHEEVI